jgi:hypothetical protein
MSRLFFFAISIDRLSGECPTCQAPVPAESIVKLSLGSLEAKIPSANGDLQILPKQTIKILTAMLYSVNFL